MAVGTVGNLAAARRPEEGWRPDDAPGDLDLPGWQEFVGARERFFAGLRRLERPGPPEGGDDRRQGAGDGPREGA